MTAIVLGLVVATRNIHDFQGTGVVLVDQGVPKNRHVGRFEIVSARSAGTSLRLRNAEVARSDPVKANTAANVCIFKLDVACREVSRSPISENE